MTKSKLFILGLEIELLSVDMNYYRGIRVNGKPSTQMMGGLLTLCFTTQGDTVPISRWMIKESKDDTWNEVDKMEKGKVCFYENGFDYPPTKTYDFNDAHLIYFKEVFCAEDEKSMQTTITISPAIQDYGTEFVKSWNVSWVPPSEIMPHQSAKKNINKKFTNSYLTNTSSEKINNFKIGDIILLCLETENRIGDKVTVNLNDPAYDFEYNGNPLKNDILEDHIISSNLEKIKLKVIKQKN